MSKTFSVYLGDTYSKEQDVGDSTISGGFNLCDWLTPQMFSCTLNGEIGELRCYGNKHPDDPSININMHQAILVQDDDSEDTVWQGVICKIHTVYSSAQEKYEV